jgi:hypothetical protein
MTHTKPSLHIGSTTDGSTSDVPDDDGYESDGSAKTLVLEDLDESNDPQGVIDFQLPKLERSKNVVPRRPAMVPETPPSSPCFK